MLRLGLAPERVSAEAMAWALVSALQRVMAEWASVPA
jgi:hypothetical protein